MKSRKMMQMTTEWVDFSKTKLQKAATNKKIMTMETI